MRERQLTIYTWFFVLAASIFSISNLIERHQSIWLIGFFMAAFAGYLILIKKGVSLNQVLWGGVMVRLLLFYSLPTLSDDLFRFIWDGTLILNGIHPFENLPGYYLDKNVPGLTEALYQRLNSPEYFTIYPPLNQFVFWLSVLVGESDWLLSANLIRFILLLADIGSFLILQNILTNTNKDPRSASWFFINPLVILEFCGNLHFEGLVIFFLLLGIYFFSKRNALSGLSFGFAIGIKLLPLIFLPFIFLKGLINKNWWVSFLAFLVGLASLIPLFNQSFLVGMQNSLGLYFQKFEFNASFYFLAREIGFLITGYNQIAAIGPTMGILTIVGILLISLRGWQKKWSLSKGMMFSLLVYLGFATTVHPWYIIPLIPLGILSGYFTPIIWSFAIFFSYLGYFEGGYTSYSFVIIAEYLVVLFTLIYEKTISRKSWLETE